MSFPEPFREPLLQTKLAAPQLRAKLVARPRLLDRLSEATTHALTLFCAPAGYGKTTLLTEWLATLPTHGPGGQPALGWVALDEEDNDPIRFLTYLAAALHRAARAAPADTRESQAMLQAFPPPPLPNILTVLLNELHTAAAPMYVVLDDYQFIDSPAIHSALAFCLDHLPPALHVILATRSDPPLPLARLRARNQLAEIRADQLRFTPAEAAAFLNQVMNLPLAPAEVAALEARTEGWIAGLQMAALSMQGRADFAAFIQAFSGSHRYILDYLAGEVLNRQTPEVQQFLILTSILERLCAALCSAVTGEPEALAVERLAYLERANLYLTALDDERRWYRYHHLFADLLKARLKQAEPGLGAQLHLRAAEWYAGQGLPLDAIHHALAAADYERAAGLIEQYGPARWSASDPAILMLAGRLPPEMLHRRPKLRLYQAWLQIAQGQTQAALPILHDLAQHLAAPAAAGWLRNAVELFAVYIASAAMPEAPVHLPDYAAFDLIPEQDLGLHDVVDVIYAALLFRAGEPERATEILAQSVQRDRAAHGIVAISLGVPLLARIRMLEGQSHAAVALCREYLLPGSQTLYGAGGLDIILGEALLDWNDLAGAEAHIRAGLQANAPWENVLFDVIGYCALARVHQAQGHLDAAQETVQALEQRLAGRTCPPDLHNEVEALKVRLWAAQGDWAPVNRWVEQVSITDTPQPRQELNGLTLARVYLAQGRHADAQRVLENLARNPGLERRLNRQCKIALLQALALSGQNQWSPAFQALETCLALAEPNGSIWLFLEPGEPVRVLLQRYLQTPASAHAAYVHTLLEAFWAAPQPAAPLSPPSVVSPRGSAETPERLTPRELDVLRLMAAGCSNRQIAEQLVLAEGTVKYYVHTVLEKLQAHNRTQALVKAREQHLV